MWHTAPFFHIALFLVWLGDAWSGGFGGKTRQYRWNMWKYVCGISWLRGLPPAHRCIRSHSLTPAQVDLQGSHWLSPPISSQPGWPICSCGRCPPLCHLCAPQPYSEPGHSSVFHTGHTHPAEEAAIFKRLAVCERKKKKKVICFCLFKHIQKDVTVENTFHINYQLIVNPCFIENKIRCTKTLRKLT